MKNNIKRITALCIALLTVLLSACGSKTMENATFGEVRKDFNDALDLSAPVFTESAVPSDFLAVYEAEDASLTGAAKKMSKAGFSGEAGVSGVNGEQDSIVFSVSVESSGFYDVTLASYTSDIGRTNNLLIDGANAGSLVSTKSSELEDVTLRYIYLEAGEHEIAVTPSWGWVDYDCLKLTACDIDTKDIYNVTAKLSNPNADDNTKRLYNFLCDIYGKYTLSGQTGDEGRESNEYLAIKDVTGKEFAVLGMDVMDYSGTAVAQGSTGETVERAYDWYVNAGGIVQLWWHWHSPQGYIPEGANWYSSFYKESSSIDLDKAMNGEDETLYNLLIEDIDRISEQLARLRDCGVPVLWRPLHEASGGWFWWGNCSAESYIKLYRLMYDRMTNYHNLTNLIWIWNGQEKDWYPGDDVVDIVSTDIYAGEHVYASQSASFITCSECPGERKLIALSENGCIPDPDLMHRDNARWLFWSVWGDDYCIRWSEPVYNEQYTDKEMLKKAYDSEYTLTLDELPNLKKYRLD